VVDVTHAVSARIHAEQFWRFATVTIRAAHRLLGGDAEPGRPRRVKPLRTRLGVRGLLAVIGVAATAMTGFTASAHADPAAAEASNPYPELRYFTEIDSAPYFLDNSGVWFVTAQGLNCGIWWRGSFGCTGDIPGAPAGVHQIGWITGDARVHYDWTMAIRFPPSQGSMTIPPLNYITFEGTTCATTFDGSTYCERGPFRMFITPTHTWLNG
jgi:hypothetical protein